MGFFLKFISWSRRIVLRQFENGPSSLKRRKGTGKTWWSYKFEVILLSGRCITLGSPGDQHEKIEVKFFVNTKFRHEKKLFFDDFFSGIKHYISALKYTTGHGQRITHQKTARQNIHRPPLRAIIKSPSSFRNHDFDAQGDRSQKEFRNPKLESQKKGGSLTCLINIPSLWSYFWEIVCRENNDQSFLH